MCGAGALRLLTLEGEAKRAVAGDAAALGALAALLRARSSAVADGATAVVWNVATEAGARDALLQARTFIQPFVKSMLGCPPTSCFLAQSLQGAQSLHVGQRLLSGTCGA